MVSTKELGRILPDRFHALANLIAQKPASYTPEWAATVDEAFRLYTNTKTVNFFHSLNSNLIELDWPFPAYLDLRAEIEKTRKDFGDLKRQNIWIGFVRTLIRGPSLSMLVFACAVSGDDAAQRATAETMLTQLFNQHADSLFQGLLTSEVLTSKQQVVRDIREASRRKLWSAAITTTVPLLDHIMRSYFGTTSLNVSIQNLRDAFEKANLSPNHLEPGHGAEAAMPGVQSVVPAGWSLGLVGVMLSSFFEFADRYYGWYKSTAEAPASALNRHAIMHGSCDTWSEANTAKLLTFVDLTLRLEKPLRVLVAGEMEAGEPRKSG